MQLTPVITIHMTAAIGAPVIGPVALWARRSAKQRPRLHRAFGYSWVTLMIAAAGSAIFIRDRGMPNLAGFTPIHFFVPYTPFGLFAAFHALIKGDIATHRRTMQGLYFGACLLAGALSLLQGRILGHLLWSQLLRSGQVKQTAEARMERVIPGRCLPYFIIFST